MVMHIYTATRGRLIGQIANNLLGSTSLLNFLFKVGEHFDEKNRRD